MKPYNIEIFDRHFNYRANALIDQMVFNYAFDGLSVEKYTIPISSKGIVIRDNTEGGEPGDFTISCSDYIRIITDDDEYTGIITGIEEDENQYNLSCVSLSKLFDHEVNIVADDIKHTNIEAYIKIILESQFIGNNDSFQNIPGLVVDTDSETDGIFDYNDTDDLYVTINILSDLIYPAFRNYLVYTNISIDFENKALNVMIKAINTENTITIESDLPNVINKTVNIRNTSDDTNKLLLIDTANYAMSEYYFYLHPSDYSFDSINNSDRFFPVKNKIYTFDSNALTEDAFLEVANENARAIKKYVSIERDLSDVELEELNQGIAGFMPYLTASKTSAEWEQYYKAIGEAFCNYIFTYWYGFAGHNYQRVNNYDDLIEEGTGHYFFAGGPTTVPSQFSAYKQKKNVHGLVSTFSNYPPITDHASLYGDLYYDTNTHADFYTTLFYQLAIIFDGSGSDISQYMLYATVHTPITSSIVTSALNAYKQTDEFRRSFELYKAQNLTSIVAGYAKKVFKTSKYKNLIELTVKADDTMINPMDLEIGQTVNIIHEGVSYNSILSGKEIKGGLVKLIFGTIRLELTKLLNMKGV